MSALPIYVFSGGESAFDMFNAVAAFCNSGDFGTMIFIGAALSFIGAMIMFIRSPSVKAFVSWFGIYFCVTQILVMPGPKVQIIDLTNPLGTYVVDHVPLGISFPAHYATMIEAGVTQKFEEVFHTPNDMDYSRTGMIFGSALFGAAAKANIPDATVIQNFNNFFENCIVPDIEINGKYTWNDLYSSGDLKKFFDSVNLSPLRGIYLQSAGGDKTFQTCKVAWPAIQGSIQNQLKNVTNNIQHILANRNGASSEGELMQSLQDSYQFYMNSMSVDAQSILMQNIYLNSIKTARAAMASGANASAAMIQASAIQAEESQEASSFTLGIMATKYLPLLQTVLFLFLVGAFPLIVMIMMQPMLFLRVFTNYLFGFVYLASWPPLFALFNYLSNVYLKQTISSTVTYNGVLNVNFYNLSQIQSANMEAASICGYLLMAIPFLAPFLVKGMAMGLSSMAQYFGGMMHGVAEHSASSYATGNLSMGNTSFNTQHANKMDSNYSYASGMSSIQMPSGTTMTQTGDGHTLYSSMQDNLPFAVGLKNSATHQLSNSLDHMTQSMVSTSASYQSSVSALSSKMMDLSHTLGSNSTTGHGFSEASVSDFRSSLNDAISIAKDAYAKQGVSVSDQQALETALSGSFSGGVSAEAKTPGPANVGANIGANVSGSASSTSQHQTMANHDFGSGLTVDQRQNLAHDLANIRSFTETAHTDTSNSTASNLLSGIRSDWQKSDQYAEQYHAQQMQEQSLRSSLNEVQSWDATTDHNKTTEFMNWLGKHDPTFASTVGIQANNLTTYQEDKLNGMIGVFVGQSYSPGASLPSHAASSINEGYLAGKEMVSGAGNASSIQGEFKQAAASTASNYHSANTPSASSIANDVKNNSAGTNGALAKKSLEVESATNQLHSQVDQNMDKDTQLAKRGALKSALDEL